MDTFQLITIKSSDPFIRGLQYGQQAEALIHLGIEGYQRHFSKTLDLTWKDITEKSRLYLDLLEREFPEELEEAAFMDGAGHWNIRTSGGHPGSELQV